jgi:hypothetical protein
MKIIAIKSGSLFMLVFMKSPLKSTLLLKYYLTEWDFSAPESNLLLLSSSYWFKYSEKFILHSLLSTISNNKFTVKEDFKIITSIIIIILSKYINTIKISYRRMCSHF